MVTRRDTDTSPLTSREHIRYVNPRWALIGGGLAAGLALLTYAISGQVYYAGEARSRIREMIPALQTLSLAVMTGSTTTLALMLTMLGITHDIDVEFGKGFYERIGHISLLATVAVVTTLLMLTFLAMPIFQSEMIPRHFYTLIYTVLIVITSLISGFLIALVIMLYNTVHDIIRLLMPDIDNAD